MADCGYLEIARIVVPAILVVIGWVVVHLLQRSAFANQELRKELRARLDRLREDLFALRKSCIDYFVSGSEEPDATVTIHILFEDVRRQFESLSATLFRDNQDKKNRAYDALAKLGQSAMGGPFETMKRKKLSPYDQQLHDIFNYSAALTNYFEDAFRDKYHKD